MAKLYGSDKSAQPRVVRDGPTTGLGPPAWRAKAIQARRRPTAARVVAKAPPKVDPAVAQHLRRAEEFDAVAMRIADRDTRNGYLRAASEERAKARAIPAAAAKITGPGTTPSEIIRNEADRLTKAALASHDQTTTSAYLDAAAELRQLVGT